jgi:hypothetical protein
MVLVTHEFSHFTATNYYWEWQNNLIEYQHEDVVEILEKRIVCLAAVSFLRAHASAVCFKARYNFFLLAGLLLQ